MRGWAAACRRLIVLSDSQVGAGRAAARRRPGALRARGQRLRSRHLPRRARSTACALWRRALVERAARLGARRGGGLGALRGGGPRGVRRRGETPVLLYVGRYTEVKRIGLLIEAYARARPGFDAPRAAGARRRLPGGVGGRAPARDDAAGPARATCSWPAGTTTRSCPTCWPPPTPWSCPRCASSSGRCWWRGWPAGGRRSPSTPTGRRRSSATARRAGWWSPTTREGLANALVHVGQLPRGARAAAGSAAAADARARYAWPALAARAGRRGSYEAPSSSRKIVA